MITYYVKGAMRTFSGYDEFYWDATGSDWTAPMSDVSVKATVPGGAQDAELLRRAGAEHDTCTSDDIADGVATFTQASLPAGEGMTIGVKIKPGLVTDNAPHLEPDGRKLSAGEKAGLVALAGVGGALADRLAHRRRAVVAQERPRPAVRRAGARHACRCRGSRRRWCRAIPICRSRWRSPRRRIPVAEAGLLIDGQVDARETAATIIDLAVKGALTVQSTARRTSR